MKDVEFEEGFRGWRDQARQLLAESIPPEKIHWRPTRQVTLPSLVPASDVKVPQRFLSIAKRVGWHRDPEKWDLLYRVLWRLTHEDPKLLESAKDRDARELASFDGDVRRELRRLRSSVHFRHWPDREGGRLVAYFAPKHPVLGAWIPDVAARHALSSWSFWTPEESWHWDLLNLERAGGQQPQRGEPLEAFWDRVIPQVPHEATPALHPGHAIGDAVVLAPADAFTGPNGRVLARALRLCGLSIRKMNETLSAPSFFSLGDALERGAPKPVALLVLGAEYAREVLGMSVAIEDRRGRVSPTLWSDHTSITLDPASLLRITDESEREHEFERWVNDLRKFVHCVDKK